MTYYRISDDEMLAVINGLGGAGERLNDLAASVKNPAPVEFVQKDLAVVRRILSGVLDRERRATTTAVEVLDETAKA